MKAKKKKKRLDARIEDYKKSMKTPNIRSMKRENAKGEGGFHKPGSMNK